ncbi:YHS domain-containing protein [Reichenbachiella faecimaris]|uniref:YHS domain-containing protein n=1 Tax=Reichenbachiella faecimaris TaxID=692418 RepID=A0A1W2GC71_REIFA|nr:YHS domain-containing (seleno)protein [Reichenbachiella faecimaris]SMD34201.1 YHS domain-containing protein [Reichenbachiella faecimaris]
MKVLKISGIIVAVLVVGIFVFAKTNHVAPLGMVSSDEFDNYSGIAIKGYDPVSYFVSDKAQLGTEDYQYEWKDAIWYFVSEENKNSFMANPEMYAPQFGGYCGFAVNAGFTAGADPTSYMIKDEKLYLFNGADVKAEAQAGGKEFFDKANANWNKK